MKTTAGPIILLLTTILLTLCYGGDGVADDTRPNIVLIVLDTLRADHLGCYGDTRGLSPFIDSLAAKGIRFQRVVSQSSWTKTSMASMFTARNPVSHNILVRTDKVASSVILLAERLQASGYRCAGIQTNPWLTREFGFDQGFDSYTYLKPTTKRGGQKPAYLRAGHVVRATARTLRKEQGRPLFLYVHFMDLHAPYEPPAPYHPGPGSTEQQRYMGEIRFLDNQLRTLYDNFRKAGLMEDSLFVLTADHGEEFGEHNGTGHGHTLYTELLHVPLILHGEGLTSHMGRKKTGRAIKQQVRLIDVAPTLLDAAGIDQPAAPDVDGESLLPLITAWFPSHRPAYSQLGLNADPQNLDQHLDRFALSTTKGKLIIDRSAGAVEFYRVRRDPGEQADRGHDPTRAMNRLQRRLDAYIENAAPPPTPEEADEIVDLPNLDQLRALGYISDDEE